MSLNKTGCTTLGTATAGKYTANWDRYQFVLFPWPTTEMNAMYKSQDLGQIQVSSRHYLSMRRSLHWVMRSSECSQIPIIQSDLFSPCFVCLTIRTHFMVTSSIILHLSYNDSVIRMFHIRTHFNGYHAVRINGVWLYMDSSIRSLRVTSRRVFICGEFFCCCDCNCLSHVTTERWWYCRPMYKRWPESPPPRPATTFLSMQGSLCISTCPWITGTIWVTTFMTKFSKNILLKR